MSVDDSTMRRVRSHFATGVTVITVRECMRTRGMTANAVSPVSLDPPLLLVCVTMGGETHRMLRQAASFAVNILCTDQQHIANRFAGRLISDQSFVTDVTVREEAQPLIYYRRRYRDLRGE